MRGAEEKRKMKGEKPYVLSRLGSLGTFMPWNGGSKMLDMPSE